VHLKQVDPAVLREVIAEGLAFAPAVARGVMVEPPRGVPEIPPLLDELRALDVDLFAVVEQDLYPCERDVPFPIATRTASYLGGCGLGPVRREPAHSPTHASGRHPAGCEMRGTAQ
jgi:inosose dehydratase